MESDSGGSSSGSSSGRSKNTNSGERTGKPRWDNKPEGMTQEDYVANNGNKYSKQKRTEEYNTAIAERGKIIGDNTNGYRLKELTKWMESMGMTQIKERLKRKFWTDNEGFNWQWDSQHGKLKKWNRRRTEHLGEFDPVTGKQTKGGESSRRWDG